VVAKKHVGECMHEDFEDATCCNPDKDADEENMKKRPKNQAENNVDW
jgi:hypothetical protein